MDVHWSDKSNFAQLGMWAPSHPEWKTTYEAARFGADTETRKTAYRKLLDLAEEESGWLLMYEPHEIYAMRDGVDYRIPTAYRPYVMPLRAGQVTVTPAN